jgi:hypothetical protein
VSEQLAVARLHTDDIEAIARRVVELQREGLGAPAPDLVDAAEIARRFGLTRSWVYEHAHELGAVRLPAPARERKRPDDAPEPKRRPRLRFDPERVAEVLKSCSTGKRAAEREAPARAESPPLRTRPGARTGGRSAPEQLLPIRGRR